MNDLEISTLLRKEVEIEAVCVEAMLLFSGLHFDIRLEKLVLEA